MKSSATFYEKYYYSGEKTVRLWLCYSVIRQITYCQPFSLLEDRLKNKHNTWLDGYDD